MSLGPREEDETDEGSDRPDPDKTSPKVPDNTPVRWEPDHSDDEPWYDDPRQLLRKAEWYSAGLDGPAQAMASSWFAAEYWKLDELLKRFWASEDEESSLRFCRALGRYWWTRDYASGWDAIDGSLGGHKSSTHSKLSAEVLGWQCRLGIRLGLLDEAERAAEIELSIARQFDDQKLEAESLNDRAVWLAWGPKDYDTADRVSARATRVAESSNNVRAHADSLDNRGYVRWCLGDLDAAEEFYRRSLSLYNEVGDRQVAGWVHLDLARVAERREDPETAQRESEIAIRIGSLLGDEGLIAWAQRPLSWVYQRSDDIGTALTLLQSSAATFGKIGNDTVQQDVTESLERLARLPLRSKHELD